MFKKSIKISNSFAKIRISFVFSMQNQYKKMKTFANTYSKTDDDI